MNNMNKCKLIVSIVVSALALIYSQTIYAACTITPIHITATVDLHISQYGINYPLTRGDYSIFATTLGKTSCNTSDYEGIRFTGSKSLSKNSDSQGNDAWVFPNSTVAIEPFVNYQGTGVTIWADGQGNIGHFRNVNTGYGINLVTIGDLISSDITIYNTPDPIGYISFGFEGFKTEYPALYLDGISVNYIKTSCGIKSKQGSTINWPNLYKGDIGTGNVESKPYSLSLICGDDSAPPSPINISFSSTNGFADAANGIVKTNLANLGLKLSWANPALPPLVLDQVNHSMLSGTGDYSVLAKPVVISQTTAEVQAGNFDTTVTMNIEFQ